LIRARSRRPALALRGAGPTAQWRRGLFAAVWLVAVASVGCGDDDGSTIHASLHGIVRDSDTGKRVAGVKVEFVADTLEQVSAKTDSDGSYALNVDTPSETGRLTASKSGYRSRVVSVFLDDADVAIDIVLTPE
jgi:Carboxypeptidase regulatory-like domain